MLVIIDNLHNDINIKIVVKVVGEEKAMGSEERRQRERDELREKILDAARDLFLEYGYEGVTMRKVAERIEYSTTAIYLHFADKETLFRELCNVDFLHLAERFQEAAQIANPVERLRKCTEIYIRFAVDHPNHYRLMFMTPKPVATAGEEALANKGDPNKDSYAFLLSLVRSAIAAGSFRPEYRSAELIAQTLWAAVHGVASLEITHRCDVWVEWTPLHLRTQAMLDGILNGLLQPQTTKASTE
jgi:AcrR family transcriptional regulator